MIKGVQKGVRSFLNDPLPGGIVVAITSIRALHSAVASKKVTTHAQCIAVCLVLANELARLDHRDGHD